MRMLVQAVPPIACVLFFSNLAFAEPRSYALPEEKTAFRPGPGVEAAQNNCLSCHSADYISTQPPQLGPKFWEGVVSKMVKAYHAPISDTDMKVIVEYLSRTY
jgi:sulfite dehydrogenase (cytochrome) subunit B